MLKSGEDVISDIKEIYIEDNVVGYQIEKPYVVRLMEKNSMFLQEETVKDLGYDMHFTPWAPLSADKKFVIPSDWVVTIYEPHDDVKNSYVKNMENRNERSSSTID